MAVVFVAQGWLRGKAVTTESGETYYSFQGIPYAKPPVGPLRFQAPEAPDPWSDVRDAQTERSVAPQTDIFTGSGFEGDEDCLFLNVYTPKLPEATSDTAKPVMVWIHGGGFYIGSANTDCYGPDHLIREDVVIVTLNYRLGALGFLSTGDSVIPGNNGLKDQVMALRWVQQNIAQFGGDPGNVTIFGESAGAACVHYHILSPMSEGLFHRAIIQSGCVLSHWAFDDPSVARRKAFRYAEALGCHTSDSKELLEFLMKVPAKELTDAMEPSLTEEEKHPVPLCFVPTKEFSRNGEETFLPDSPTNILTQGKFHKVPIIIGVTSNEGMFVMKDIAQHPSWYEALSKRFRVPVPHNFRIEENTAKYEELAARIKEFYFGTEPFSKDTWPKFADLYSDFWFVSGITQTIRKQVAVASIPIYFYCFAFDGNFGLYDMELGSNRLPGACHGAELGYLFQMTIAAERGLQLNEDGLRVRSQIVKLWTNFAKSGLTPPIPVVLLKKTFSHVRSQHVMTCVCFSLPAPTQFGYRRD
ncbi:hypothetical protein B7P43_G10290 [Cryptotermes secundus]|uniref:Carboxylic ester hydrolase n=1 Tax=Cryptotermes secundus TaxID=105785 RepID=A0A2J7RMN3_9NEOP|nr:hypothetical protein B7P43_G10290 [Cryptotermes secundus]